MKNSNEVENLDIKDFFDALLTCSCSFSFSKDENIEKTNESIIQNQNLCSSKKYLHEIKPEIDELSNNIIKLNEVSIQNQNLSSKQNNQLSSVPEMCLMIPKKRISVITKENSTLFDKTKFIKCNCLNRKRCYNLDKEEDPLFAAFSHSLDRHKSDLNYSCLKMKNFNENRIIVINQNKTRFYDTDKRPIFFSNRSNKIFKSPLKVIVKEYLPSNPKNKSPKTCFQICLFTRIFLKKKPSFTSYFLKICKIFEDDMRNRLLSDQHFFCKLSRNDFNNPSIYHLIDIYNYEILYEFSKIAQCGKTSFNFHILSAAIKYFLIKYTYKLKYKMIYIYWLKYISNKDSTIFYKTLILLIKNRAGISLHTNKALLNQPDFKLLLITFKCCLRILFKRTYKNDIDLLSRNYILKNNSSIFYKILRGEDKEYQNLNKNPMLIFYLSQESWMSFSYNEQHYIFETKNNRKMVPFIFHSQKTKRKLLIYLLGFNTLSDFSIKKTRSHFYLGYKNAVKHCEKRISKNKSILRKEIIMITYEATNIVFNVYNSELCHSIAFLVEIAISLTFKKKPTCIWINLISTFNLLTASERFSSRINLEVFKLFHLEFLQILQIIVMIFVFDSYFTKHMCHEIKKNWRYFLHKKLHIFINIFFRMEFLKFSITNPDTYIKLFTAQCNLLNSIFCNDCEFVFYKTYNIGSIKTIAMGILNHMPIDEFIACTLTNIDKILFFGLLRLNYQNKNGHDMLFFKRFEKFITVAFQTSYKLIKNNISILFRKVTKRNNHQKVCSTILNEFLKAIKFSILSQNQNIENLNKKVNQRCRNIHFKSDSKESELSKMLFRKIFINSYDTDTYIDIKRVIFFIRTKVWMKKYSKKLKKRNPLFKTIQTQNRIFRLKILRFFVLTITTQLKIERLRSKCLCDLMNSNKFLSLKKAKNKIDNYAYTSIDLPMIFCIDSPIVHNPLVKKLKNKSSCQKHAKFSLMLQNFLKPSSQLLKRFFGKEVSRIQCFLLIVSLKIFEKQFNNIKDTFSWKIKKNQSKKHFYYFFRKTGAFNLGKFNIESIYMCEPARNLKVIILLKSINTNNPNFYKKEPMFSQNVFFPLKLHRNTKIIVEKRLSNTSRRLSIFEIRSSGFSKKVNSSYYSPIIFEQNNFYTLNLKRCCTFYSINEIDFYHKKYSNISQPCLSEIETTRKNSVFDDHRKITDIDDFDSDIEISRCSYIREVSSKDVCVNNNSMFSDLKDDIPPFSSLIPTKSREDKKNIEIVKKYPSSLVNDISNEVVPKIPHFFLNKHSTSKSTKQIPLKINTYKKPECQSNSREILDYSTVVCKKKNCVYQSLCTFSDSFHGSSLYFNCKEYKCRLFSQKKLQKRLINSLNFVEEYASYVSDTKSTTGLEFTSSKILTSAGKGQLFLSFDFFSTKKKETEYCNNERQHKISKGSKIMNSLLSHHTKKSDNHCCIKICNNGNYIHQKLINKSVDFNKFNKLKILHKKFNISERHLNKYHENLKQREGNIARSSTCELELKEQTGSKTHTNINFQKLPDKKDAAFMGFKDNRSNSTKSHSFYDIRIYIPNNICIYGYPSIVNKLTELNRTKIHKSCFKNDINHDQKIIFLKKNIKNSDEYKNKRTEICLQTAKTSPNLSKSLKLNRFSFCKNIILGRKYFLNISKKRNNSCNGVNGILNIKSFFFKKESKQRVLFQQHMQNPKTYSSINLKNKNIEKIIFNKIDLFKNDFIYIKEKLQKNLPYYTQNNDMDVFNRSKSLCSLMECESNKLNSHMIPYSLCFLKQTDRVSKFVKPSLSINNNVFDNETNEIYNQSVGYKSQTYKIITQNYLNSIKYESGCKGSSEKKHLAKRNKNFYFVPKTKFKETEYKESLDCNEIRHSLQNNKFKGTENHGCSKITMETFLNKNLRGFQNSKHYEQQERFFSKKNPDFISNEKIKIPSNKFEQSKKLCKERLGSKSIEKGALKDINCDKSFRFKNHDQSELMQNINYLLKAALVHENKHIPYDSQQESQPFTAHKNTKNHVLTHKKCENNFNFKFHKNHVTHKYHTSKFSGTLRNELQKTDKCQNNCHILENNKSYEKFVIKDESIKIPKNLKYFSSPKKDEKTSNRLLNSEYFENSENRKGPKNTNRENDIESFCLSETHQPHDKKFSQEISKTKTHSYSTPRNAFNKFLPLQKFQSRQFPRNNESKFDLENEPFQSKNLIVTHKNILESLKSIQKVYNTSSQRFPKVSKKACDSILDYKKSILESSNNKMYHRNCTICVDSLSISKNSKKFKKNGNYYNSNDLNLGINNNSSLKNSSRIPDLLLKSKNNKNRLVSEQLTAKKIKFQKSLPFFKDNSYYLDTTSQQFCGLEDNRGIESQNLRPNTSILRKSLSSNCKNTSFINKENNFTHENLEKNSIEKNNIQNSPYKVYSNIENNTQIQDNKILSKCISFNKSQIIENKTSSKSYFDNKNMYQMDTLFEKGTNCYPNKTKTSEKYLLDDSKSNKYEQICSESSKNKSNCLKRFHIFEKNTRCDKNVNNQVSFADYNVIKSNRHNNNILSKSIYDKNDKNSFLLRNNVSHSKKCCDEIAHYDTKYLGYCLPQNRYQKFNENPLSPFGDIFSDKIFENEDFKRRFNLKSKQSIKYESAIQSSKDKEINNLKNIHHKPSNLSKTVYVNSKNKKRDCSEKQDSHYTKIYYKKYMGVSNIGKDFCNRILKKYSNESNIIEDFYDKNRKSKIQNLPSPCNPTEYTKHNRTATWKFKNIDVIYSNQKEIEGEGKNHYTDKNLKNEVVLRKTSFENNLTDSDQSKQKCFSLNTSNFQNKEKNQENDNHRNSKEIEKNIQLQEDEKRLLIQTSCKNKNFISDSLFLKKFENVPSITVNTIQEFQSFLKKNSSKIENIDTHESLLGSKHQKKLKSIKKVAHVRDDSLLENLVSNKKINKDKFIDIEKLSGDRNSKKNLTSFLDKCLFYAKEFDSDFQKDDSLSFCRLQKPAKTEKYSSKQNDNYKFIDGILPISEYSEDLQGSHIRKSKLADFSAKQEYIDQKNTHSDFRRLNHEKNNCTTIPLNRKNSHMSDQNNLFHIAKSKKFLKTKSPILLPKMDNGPKFLPSKQYMKEPENRKMDQIKSLKAFNKEGFHEHKTFKSYLNSLKKKYALKKSLANLDYTFPNEYADSKLYNRIIKPKNYYSIHCDQIQKFDNNDLSRQIVNQNPDPKFQFQKDFRFSFQEKQKHFYVQKFFQLTTQNYNSSKKIEHQNKYEKIKNDFKTREKIHRPFRCSILGCKKAYTSAYGLKYHKEYGHNKIIDITKPFACNYVGCEKRYKNPNGLKYHKEYGHKS